MNKLNKAEQTEPMAMTFGRIRTAAHQLKHPRLIALVEKFNHNFEELSNHEGISKIIIDIK